MPLLAAALRGFDVFLGFAIQFMSWMPWGDQELQPWLELGKIFSVQALEN